MLDFELTDSGDIMITKSKRIKERLNIEFCVSKSKALKISYFTEGNPLARKSEDTLSIAFSIGNDNSDKYEINTIINERALAQSIKNRLQTSLGDLNHNPNFGSKLELVKHKPLLNTSTAIQTKSIIAEAIKDLNINPEIIITPVVKNIKGYSQNLEIKIINEGKLILNYTI